MSQDIKESYGDETETLLKCLILRYC